MKEEFLNTIIESQEKRQAIVYLLNIDNHDEKILYPNEKTGNKELDVKLLECIRSDKSMLLSIDNQNYFIDIYNPPLKLIIIGAVHIAQHLILFAKNLNFDCILIDPREGFANAERFPGVKIYNNWPDEVMNNIDIDHRTAIVTLTHDPKIDDVALRLVLKCECFYIGSLGSRKTHLSRLDRLGLDFNSSDLKRIHGPIGLNIGARTPVEIALSIVGEIISILRN